MWISQASVYGLCRMLVAFVYIKTIAIPTLTSTNALVSANQQFQYNVESPTVSVKISKSIVQSSSIESSGAKDLTRTQTDSQRRFNANENTNRQQRSLSSGSSFAPAELDPNQYSPPRLGQFRSQDAVSNEPREYTGRTAGFHDHGQSSQQLHPPLGGKILDYPGYSRTISATKSIPAAIILQAEPQQQYRPTSVLGKDSAQSTMSQSVDHYNSGGIMSRSISPKCQRQSLARTLRSK